MKSDSDIQIETEIDAFVNGQLDAERRFAVAAYLAENPQRAAEAMAELRAIEGLRLAHGAVELPCAPHLDRAAAQLARGLGRRRYMRRLQPVAAAAAMFVFGWSAHTFSSADRQDAQTTSSATLLEAALDAQDAVSLRLSLTSEIGPMPNNAEEISERLGITLPDFPKGWVIRGAQVVATPERPGVALVIDTPDLGQIMLFSVLRTKDGPDSPAVATSQNGRGLAYFENERTAFVLVDNSGPIPDLRRGAEELRHRLN